MASSRQHNTDLDPSDIPAAAHKQYGEEEIPISYRLRDRNMLRKKREKAQEDSAYWIFREPKFKKQRKARGDRKGSEDQLVVKVEPEEELKAEPEVEPQAGQSEVPVEQLADLEDVQPKPKPKLQKCEPVAPMPAPPGPVQKEQLFVLTTQDLDAGIPMGGDEELLNLTEAEIPDNLNAPLDSLCQDNEHISFLF